MPRPSQRREQRDELLPILAAAFTQLGYRRTTTAALAERCGVQENILYRLWPDKKAMFLAAIEYVYDFSEQTWLRMLERSRGPGSAARRLLEFESQHHGEFGHYRIIFSGLGETDDPEIRDALKRLFARFHRFLLGQIVAHRSGAAAGSALSAETAAWGVIGLGTIVNIGRELGMLSDPHRKQLIGDVGERLLEGGSA
jgi:AcrR family transcriptional regulator